MTIRFPHKVVYDFPGIQRNFEFLETVLQTNYFSGAGKTTVVDANFGSAPLNGTLAVHYDTTAAKTYLSVRANGAWHVMAGPV